MPEIDSRFSIWDWGQPVQLAN